MPKRKGGNDKSSGGQHSAGQRVMLTKNAKADSNDESSGGQHSAGQRVMLAQNSKADSSGGQPDFRHELFLGNLPNDIPPDDIKEKLGCTTVRVMTETHRMVDDRGNEDLRQQTYAFVAFDDPAAAKAVYGQCWTFCNRTARIYFAESQKRKRV